MQQYVASSDFKVLYFSSSFICFPIKKSSFYAMAQPQVSENPTFRLLTVTALVLALMTLLSIQYQMTG